MTRRRAVLAAALLLPALLAGCTEAGAQAPGDPSVTEWTHPTTAPVDFSGPTADGGEFTSSAYRGRVLVVNFWYKDCPPCNAEAPVLKSLAAQFHGDDVQFVGVNTSDDAANARSFDQQYGIAYPSILDQSNAGAAQLAFSGAIGPKTIPATLVLDRKGRVVARLIGQADPSTLKTLIQDAVDGKAA